ncbi:type II toxin-antitoxin system prevent-host-death family antitoxin [Bacillus alkalisoli]|uniref:type II toxin-antitoxin system prevent-host-death family antitoxin n=1 Tax=Bacillus alkalisoli TaxID=2011008 RepID=UPI000C23AF70|nr:type II toxin-antitoxin system prevent-host-death family antitoxin [Bacillus alkalisoli]
MKVSSTELQNNFGKYLILAAQEDIFITRNGTEIAKLSTVKNCNQVQGTVAREIIQEIAPVYGYGKRATYDEFLQIQQNSDERYEYIDGEIFLLASPKTAHQYSVTKLTVIFSNYFQDSTCTPIVAPYDIELRRTPEQVSIVQPDLMVICDLEDHLDDNDYYKGVPILIVEVISKSTQRKDLIQKLDLYMSCGVKEYWIVNPNNRQVTVYHFEEQNIANFFTYKNNEVIHSYIFDGLLVDMIQIFR